MLIEYILLLLCLLFSAYCSGIETAFTSLSSVQIVSMKESRGKRGALIEKLILKYEYFLVTVLVGNTFANVAASVLSTEIAVVLFNSRALGFSTGILTFIILVFCELTPKRLALLQNEWIAIHTVRSIYVLTILLWPLSWLLLLLNSLFGSMLGKQKQTLTIEGLNYLVSRAEDLGVLEQSRSQMVRNTFRLGNTTLLEVMTHRQDVFSLEQDMNIQDALSLIVEKNFSRIPVYSRDEENIIGVVTIKELLRNIKKKNCILKDIMMPPLYMPTHKRLTTVLNFFLQEKTNMAIVLDEYGGLAGIVTIEDILEEIVGEMHDEHETNPPKNLVEVAPNRFLVLGKTQLAVLRDVIPNFEIPYNGTISAYLNEFLGRIPSSNEEIETPIGVFRIQKVQKRRIEQLLFYPKL